MSYRKNKLYRFFKVANKKEIVKSFPAFQKKLRENPNPKVYLDSPMGSEKPFGFSNRILPFDYGEVSEWINPADDMGWDIIIPPSNRSTNNLRIVGLVQVNDDPDIWMDLTGKKPPKGNDKVIVSDGGKISGEDIRIIEDFFSTMWQFKKVIWLF
jgi:hypothetical protein